MSDEVRSSQGSGAWALLSAGFVMLGACVAPVDEQWAAADDAGVGVGVTEQELLLGSCGSDSTLWDQGLSYAFVPDHFPDDSALSLSRAFTWACVLYGAADFTKACDAHDICYTQDGETQQSCDTAVIRGWRKACKRTYGLPSDSDGWGYLWALGTSVATLGTEEACRGLCLAEVELMGVGVKNFGGSAFKIAQRTGTVPSTQQPSTVDENIHFDDDFLEDALAGDENIHFDDEALSAALYEAQVKAQRGAEEKAVYEYWYGELARKKLQQELAALIEVTVM